MSSDRLLDSTRDRLLSAAFQEIRRNGFQAASLNGILACAGLTKGALYHYFPSKQALGLAVVDEVISSYLERHILAPLRLADDPVAALTETIGRFAEDAGPDQVSDVVNWGCPLNNLIQEMSSLDAAFNERLTRLGRLWQAAVADALGRGRQAGRVRADADLEAAALFIFAAWEGCAGAAKNARCGETFRRCMRELQHYVRGLETP